MESVTTIKEAIAYLRKNADMKKTKYFCETRYGHILRTIKYFAKNTGQEIGTVHKNGRDVKQVKIELDEDNTYSFTENGKQKVRPLQV
jgi:hypothetical protein